MIDVENEHEVSTESEYNGGEVVSSDNVFDDDLEAIEVPIYNEEDLSNYEQALLFLGRIPHEEIIEEIIIKEMPNKDTFENLERYERIVNKAGQRRNPVNPGGNRKAVTTQYYRKPEVSMFSPS